MRIIGLTGGIASGKSTVSNILKEKGCKIIDADKIARMVVKPGTAVFQNIVKVFGNGVLNKDGDLNRKLLGDIVFNDPEKLKILNQITHPEIKKIMQNEIEKTRNEKEDNIIVIDAAVLLESGMDELVDEIWLVYVDFNTQLKRLMERDAISKEQAIARIRSQMPVEEKIKRSHKIIDNSKDIMYTREQVSRLIDSIGY